MKRIAAFCCFCALMVCFWGCGDKKSAKADLSTLNFVNVEWTRDTGYCTETLCFRDNGDCSYYCACGEPVNDDDLCRGYRYDPESKTIYLEFDEPSDQTVTQITVKRCDGEVLVLDFGGEERMFEKAQSASWDPDTLAYEGETYVYLQFPGDIFYYDLRESVDYEEDEMLPIPHEQWKLLYYEGDLFVLESQLEAAAAYFSNDENYTWSAVVEDNDSEEAVRVPLTLSAQDSAYIYAMEAVEWEKTLFFDDIEIFGTLAKTSKDGLIEGRTSLACRDGVWYWRSEIIDDAAEGWPEYVVPLPEAVTGQIG